MYNDEMVVIAASQNHGTLTQWGGGTLTQWGGGGGGRYSAPLKQHRDNPTKEQDDFMVM